MEMDTKFFFIPGTYITFFEVSEASGSLER